MRSRVDLAQRAHAVLEGNWLGAAMRPGTRGLVRHGRARAAQRLIEATLALVGERGFWE